MTPELSRCSYAQSRSLLLARAVGTEDHERRESTPLVNTTAHC